MWYLGNHNNDKSTLLDFGRADGLIILEDLSRVDKLKELRLTQTMSGINRNLHILHLIMVDRFHHQCGATRTWWRRPFVTLRPRARTSCFRASSTSPSSLSDKAECKLIAQCVAEPSRMKGAVERLVAARTGCLGKVKSKNVKSKNIMLLTFGGAGQQKANIR